jgi:hypothetical protein
VRICLAALGLDPVADYCVVVLNLGFSTIEFLNNQIAFGCGCLDHEP